MKKVIFTLIVVILTLCLVGCDDSMENTIKQTDNDGIYIWIDEETGVQYIIYSKGYGYTGMGGITPRLNADGTLYTESEDTEDE